MKKIFFFSIIAMIFSACKKDQTVIDNLSGNWVVKQSNYQSSSSIFSIGDRLIFYNCDIAKGVCSGTHIIPGSGWGSQASVNSFQYVVYNNGTTFSIDYGSGADIVDISINELTTTSLTFTFSYGYTITLAKA